MSAATAVAGVPFDLVEVKLAAPLERPGTVAKESLIARLRASTSPLATVVAPPGTARRRCSRSGPRQIRVRSRGSRSTAGTTMPWCSCATSRPLFTSSSRSRWRCSRPCPGPEGRRGRPGFRVSGAHCRASRARWCWCSTTSTQSPVLRAWMLSRRSWITSQPARRSRSRAGKRRRFRSAAGVPRDACRSSVSPTYGWTSARPGCCWRPRGSNSTSARCPT